MLESARTAGVAPTEPLFLVLDNASIHHTKDVQAAAARVSSRIVLTYLPPYASTMNPVELLNSDLKAVLGAEAPYPPSAHERKPGVAVRRARAAE
jgi:transposase